MKKLTPDSGVPITPEAPHVDLRHRIDASVATIEWLRGVDTAIYDDLDVQVEQQDIEYANEIVASFAQDPEKTSMLITHQSASKMRPATVLAVKAVLDKFGHHVVESSLIIRHLVVNKLILLSDSKDPRISLRALENLGKMQDVALFSERSEVTITHQSTDDLKAKLKAKLDMVRERAVTLHANKDGVYEASKKPLKVKDIQL